MNASSSSLSTRRSSGEDAGSVKLTSRLSIWMGSDGRNKGQGSEEKDFGGIVHREGENET